MAGKVIKPIESLFGAVAAVAEAAAAGALKEGARRARAVVREVDGRLGKVEQIGRGGLETCAACGMTKREHEVITEHQFVGKARRRSKKASP